MKRNRFKRIVFYATAVTALLVALVALLIIVEQRRTQAETGDVLSALFSQRVLRDMDKWSGGRTITIAVMRNPDCRICTEPQIALEFQQWFGREAAKIYSWRSATMGSTRMARRAGR
jgi:hypothetical protein